MQQGTLHEGQVGWEVLKGLWQPPNHDSMWTVCGVEWYSDWLGSRVLLLGAGCTPCCAGPLLGGCWLVSGNREASRPPLSTINDGLHPGLNPGLPKHSQGLIQLSTRTPWGTQSPGMQSFLSSLHNSEWPKWSLWGLKGRREGGTAPVTTLEPCCSPQGGFFVLLRPGYLKDTGAKARQGNLEG